MEAQQGIRMQYHYVHCTGCGRRMTGDKLAFDMGRLIAAAVKRKANREVGADHKWECLSQVDICMYYTWKDLQMLYGLESEQKSRFIFRVRNLKEYLVEIAGAEDFDQLYDALSRESHDAAYIEKMARLFAHIKPILQVVKERYEARVEMNADQLEEAIKRIINTCSRKQSDDDEEVIVRFDVLPCLGKDDMDHVLPQGLDITFENGFPGMPANIRVRTMICPYCGKSFYQNAGMYEEVIIGMAGTARVGKTAYLAALMHQLNKQNGGIVRIYNTTDAEWKYFEDKILTPYESGERIVKTAFGVKMDTVPLFSVQIEIVGKVYIFTFIDMPGEVFDQDDTRASNDLGRNVLLNDRRILRWANAIWCCFSPEQIDEELRRENRDASQEDIVNTQMVHVLGGLSDKLELTDAEHKPAAVLVTMSDKIGNMASGGNYAKDLFAPDTNVLETFLDASGMLKLGPLMNHMDHAKKYMDQCDVLINQMETVFAGYGMFAVAAYGCQLGTPEFKLRPSMVELPFLWTMAELGHLKVVEETYQDRGKKTSRVIGEEDRFTYHDIMTYQNEARSGENKGYHYLSCTGCGEKIRADKLAFDFGALVNEAVSRKANRQIARDEKWLVLSRVDLKLYYTWEEMRSKFTLNPAGRSAVNFTVKDLREVLAEKGESESFDDLYAAYQDDKARGKEDVIGLLTDHVGYPLIDVGSRTQARNGSGIRGLIAPLEDILYRCSKRMSSEDEVIAEFEIEPFFCEDDQGNRLTKGIEVVYHDSGAGKGQYDEVTRKICPHCGKRFYSLAGKHREILVGMAGTARVGKTAYLAALINRLQKYRGQLVKIVMPAGDPEWLFFNDKILAYYQKGQRIDKTAFGANTDTIPLFSVLIKVAGEEIIFTFIDMPGETFGSSKEGEADGNRNNEGFGGIAQELILNDRRVIQHADIIWCCFAPEQIQRSIAQVQKSMGAGEDVIDTEMKLILGDMQERLRDVGADHKKAAVLITMCDKIGMIPPTELDGFQEVGSEFVADLFQPDFNVWQNYLMNDGMDARKVKEKMVQTKRYMDLCKDVGNTLGNIFKEGYGIFPVAAYGMTLGEANFRLRPSLVELPFIWTLVSLGVIEANKETEHRKTISEIMNMDCGLGVRIAALWEYLFVPSSRIELLVENTSERSDIYIN